MGRGGDAFYWQETAIDPSEFGAITRAKIALTKVVSDELVLGISLLARSSRRPLDPTFARCEAELGALREKVRAGALPASVLGSFYLTMKALLSSLAELRPAEDKPRIQDFARSSGLLDPPALLPHPKYKFTQDLFGVYEEQWRADYGSFAGKPNLHFVEIGSFEGRSTIWLLDNILTDPTSRLTSIDPFTTRSNPKAREYFEHNLALHGADRFEMRVGQSVVVLPTLEPQSIDFIYVDGTLTTDLVMLDGLLGWRLLKPGGIMVFGNYRYEVLLAKSLLSSAPVSMVETIHMFLRMHDRELDVVHRDFQLAVRRRPPTARRSAENMVGV